MNNTNKDKPSVRDFNLTNYLRAKDKMISTNTISDKNFLGISHSSKKNYTLEEVEEIISSNSYKKKRELSRYYFENEGYYQQIVIHYATLLKYVGVLIPKVNPNKKITEANISKKYNQAIKYIDSINLPIFCTNCTKKILIDGAYYGLIVAFDKKNFTIMDLPMDYCRSRFKDYQGRDLIEFNVEYFNTIRDKETRKIILQNFPTEIVKAYKKLNKPGTKREDKWAIIPAQLGVYFSLFTESPMLLSTIPAIMTYEENEDIKQEKNKDEIKKILIQKVPHLQDGRLLFEPEEAAEMHDAAVKMMSGNPNISVLTTYTDVDVATSDLKNNENKNTIENLKDDIYTKGGVSGQLFSASNSTTVKDSIKNDISMMMYLAQKFSSFITNIINFNFGNSNLTFKYDILPISIHNEDDYITKTFKLASSGYSLLIPSIALGFSQSDLTDIKNLENDLLKLSDKLIPLTSAFNSSGETLDKKNGRPKMAQEDKKESTIQKEKSIENGEGSN